MRKRLRDCLRPMSAKENELRHLPVMADEVVKFLITDPGGAYVELTAGFGGHLRALAEALGSKARLYGLDKDPVAVKEAKRNLAGCGQVRKIVTANYEEINRVAGQFEDKTFDGILLDLGLSSAQLDDPHRGFSFRYNGSLDMRYDPKSQEKTAADLINSLSAPELTEIIRSFGEERFAPRLAREIVRERKTKAIETTGELTRIITQVVKPPYQTKSLARVFQAFRIAVNRELDALQFVLPEAFALLRVGGRFVVISYHSLEDRIVKRFFQKEAKGCICPPQLPECVCNRLPRARIITRKVLTPQEREKEHNPRSRSAKLRVAEKTAA